MEQTATLSRPTLLNVFLSALTDKVNAFSKDILSPKVKKVLITGLYDYVNARIHTYGKPILLPNEFHLKKNRTYGVDVFTFYWEQQSLNEDGGFEFICGGFTKMQKYKEIFLKDADCIRSFCKISWDLIEGSFLVDKLPDDCKTLTLMNPISSPYESENCPICLDLWSEGADKKTARCGHSCCLTCMQSVVMSNNPDCPICRSNYLLNGTYRYIENPPLAEEWYNKQKTKFDRMLDMWELEAEQESMSKDWLRWLKTFIDVRRWKKQLIFSYGMDMFMDRLLHCQTIYSRPNVNGVDLYIFKHI